LSIYQRMLPAFSEERDCFRPQDKHKDALTDHHNCVVDRIEMFQKILDDETASRAEPAGSA